MHIFDTKARALVQLKPIDGKTIRMYTCGPTVYNFPHIGNLRTYVAEDLLRRTIQFFGMGVYQVMNLTDIDDKTIRGAITKGCSLKEFTDVYTKAFFEDLAALQIEKVERYTPATEHLPEMIAMISMLIAKGFAYATETGDVFYRIARFAKYGALSHLKLDTLKEGASKRVSNDEYDKEHASDFALWKAYDPKVDGEIYWDSPWGKGRPGWHIECSAMAIKHLGETIDLHVGGVDNMFPHHENEIAQSEGCTGKTFSQHWMHVEHLLVDGKKMSKSLGNFYTLRDLFQKEYGAREIRYLLISTHYRTQLNFTFEGLDSAKQSLRRIDDFLLRLQEASGTGVSIAHELEGFEKGFREGLGDDLNIATALAALYDFIRKMNIYMDEKKLGSTDAAAVIAVLRKFDTVLGFVFHEEEAVSDAIAEKAKARVAARKEKNWALADTLRKEVDAAGYIIEDKADGGFSIKRK